ncbi:MAG: hypothetical protein JSW07_13625, partial [bacterium]
MRILLLFLLIILIVLTFKNTIFSQCINIEHKPSNVSVSFNGTFIVNSPSKTSRVNSENGTFWCEYDIGQVSDEMRELKNFRFYRDNRLLFTLEQAPGSDIYISNSGICAFMDLTHHYKSEVKIHFYSNSGQHLFSETLLGASLFGFSIKGNKFGVGNAKYLKIVSIPDHHIETFEGGYQFDISEDENLVAVAMRGKVRVYRKSKLLKEFTTDFIHTRKIKVSENHNFLVVIDKKHLKVFSLSNGEMLFEDRLKGKNSFRDLILNEGMILTGVHYRNAGVSKGILKIYDVQGKVILEKEESVKQFN